MPTPSMTVCPQYPDFNSLMANHFNKKYNSTIPEDIMADLQVM